MRVRQAAILALVTGIVLVWTSFHASTHTDEAQDAWGGYYITGELAHLDFSWSGGTYEDPNWDPRLYWSRTQPMGVRWLQGLTMRVGDLAPPPRPYSYTDPALQGPDTGVPHKTLRVLRIVSSLLAALGFGLLALRLGWKAWAGAAVMLATTVFREDLSRAWSEGPLLFGFGLCVATYGRRAFAPAGGLTAAFKLTGMAFWPLLLVRGAAGRLSRGAALAVTVLLWTLLNPQSWVYGGAPYLVTMWSQRYGEWHGQSEKFGGPLGAFFPSRYQWPIELALVLLLAFAAEHGARRLRRLRASATLDPRLDA